MPKTGFKMMNKRCCHGKPLHNSKTSESEIRKYFIPIDFSKTWLDLHIEIEMFPFLWFSKKWFGNFYTIPRCVRYRNRRIISVTWDNFTIGSRINATMEVLLFNCASGYIAKMSRNVLNATYSCNCGLGVVLGIVIISGLTHWGRDKMTAISQRTFSNGFSWMKMYEFHWIALFLRIQFTIFHHWFR